MSVMQPKRVLVVEDNPEVLAVLREVLARHGYEVEEARHGAAALVALTRPAASLPDVVILDIGLPVQSGVSILDFVRNVRRSDVPVVVLTGSATHEQEAELQHLGISEYLRKPASSQAVLAAVARALGSDPQAD